MLDVVIRNGTVIDGTALTARFRHTERAAEGPAYGAWFRAAGFAVHQARHVNEGEGDLLLVGDTVYAGTGFRTDPRAHGEAARRSESQKPGPSSDCSL